MAPRTFAEEEEEYHRRRPTSSSHSRRPHSTPSSSRSPSPRSKDDMTTLSGAPAAAAPSPPPPGSAAARQNLLRSSAMLQHSRRFGNSLSCRRLSGTGASTRRLSVESQASQEGGGSSSHHSNHSSHSGLEGGDHGEEEEREKRNEERAKKSVGSILKRLADERTEREEQNHQHQHTQRRNHLHEPLRLRRSLAREEEGGGGRMGGIISEREQAEEEEEGITVAERVQRRRSSLGGGIGSGFGSGLGAGGGGAGAGGGGELERLRSRGRPALGGASRGMMGGEPPRRSQSVPRNMTSASSFSSSSPSFSARRGHAASSSPSSSSPTSSAAVCAANGAFAASSAFNADEFVVAPPARSLGQRSGSSSALMGLNSSSPSGNARIGNDSGVAPKRRGSLGQRWADRAMDADNASAAVSSSSSAREGGRSLGPKSRSVMTLQPTTQRRSSLGDRVRDMLRFDDEAVLSAVGGLAVPSHLSSSIAAPRSASLHGGGSSPRGGGMKVRRSLGSRSQSAMTLMGSGGMGGGAGSNDPVDGLRRLSANMRRGSAGKDGRDNFRNNGGGGSGNDNKSVGGERREGAPPARRRSSLGDQVKNMLHLEDEVAATTSTPAQAAASGAHPSVPTPSSSTDEPQQRRQRPTMGSKSRSTTALLRDFGGGGGGNGNNSVPTRRFSFGHASGRERPRLATQEENDTEDGSSGGHGQRKRPSLSKMAADLGGNLRNALRLDEEVKSSRERQIIADRNRVVRGRASRGTSSAAAQALHQSSRCNAPDDDSVAPSTVQTAPPALSRSTSAPAASSSSSSAASVTSAPGRFTTGSLPQAALRRAAQHFHLAEEEEVQHRGDDVIDAGAHRAAGAEGWTGAAPTPEPSCFDASMGPVVSYMAPTNFGDDYDDGADDDDDHDDDGGGNHNDDPYNSLARGGVGGRRLSRGGVGGDDDPCNNLRSSSRDRSLSPSRIVRGALGDGNDDDDGERQNQASSSSVKIPKSSFLGSGDNLTVLDDFRFKVVDGMIVLADDEGPERNGMPAAAAAARLSFGANPRGNGGRNEEWPNSDVGARSGHGGGGGGIRGAGGGVSRPQFREGTRAKGWM